MTTAVSAVFSPQKSPARLLLTGLLLTVVCLSVILNLDIVVSGGESWAAPVLQAAAGNGGLYEELLILAFGVVAGGAIPSFVLILLSGSIMHLLGMRTARNAGFTRSLAVAAMTLGLTFAFELTLSVVGTLVAGEATTMVYLSPSPLVFLILTYIGCKHYLGSTSRRAALVAAVLAMLLVAGLAALLLA